MNEEDFRALIEYLMGQLRSIGANDIADERHYLRSDDGGGEATLLPPRERLIAMLQALDRYLAVQDRAMYKDAMGRIAENVEQAPTSVRVASFASDAAEPLEVDLANAPDLFEVRQSLNALIQQLKFQDLEPPPSLRA